MDYMKTGLIIITQTRTHQRTHTHTHTHTHIHIRKPEQERHLCLSALVYALRESTIIRYYFHEVYLSIYRVLLLVSASSKLHAVYIQIHKSHVLSVETINII